MKRIDIHFVSWQRPKITELAIKTIVRNTRKNSYRLIVYDNNSSDDQKQMLFKLLDGGLIDELVLGPRNIGLEKARTFLLKNYTDSDFFICADNDCLPEPMDRTDWVEKLVDLMEHYPDYGAISCRTQVMIGTGNIFEDETKDITDFPHPGGSLRIMRSALIKSIGGWRDDVIGRGAEERYIGEQIHLWGFKTGFATHIKTLHLFGLQDTDRWGYDYNWEPEKTGHSDISHPVLENGDDPQEVARYAGKELTDAYLHN